MRFSQALYILLSSLLSLFFLKASAQSENPYMALEFTENLGQWGEGFDYRADVGNGSIFLHNNGFTIVMYHEEDYARITQKMHGFFTDSLAAREAAADTSMLMRAHSFRVVFEGATVAKARSVPDGELQSNINYFIGSDPAKWKTGVRSFESVTYHNVYPGIDVRYYSYGGGIKYDIIVQPGADRSQIKMRYLGADKLSIEKGILKVSTSVGFSNQLEPYTYQITEGLKKDVACRYRLKGNLVTYDVQGVDPGAKLVIDPFIVIAAFSGSTLENWGFTATPGIDGSLYAGGIVLSYNAFSQKNPSFPTTSGAFQGSLKGGVDIGIMRYSSNGRQRLYSTFIGGGENDVPHSMIADDQGNLVILGRSNSNDYPVRGYASATRGGADIVVSKLSADGRALLGSAVIGGSNMDGANMFDDYSYKPTFRLAYNYGDQSRSEVILANDGNILVVSNTTSANFPTVGSSSVLSGKQDAVVMKLSAALNNLMFSTIIGGSDDDAGFGIKENPKTGEIYIAGPTLSTNFPGSKAGTIGTVLSGNIDGYVAILSPAGNLLRSTYLGTGSDDIIYCLQFDKLGYPYVLGISLGSWPVQNATFSNAGAKQFVAKLEPDLSAYKYSTVFGTMGSSLPNISPVAFLVDRCENVYVSGWGSNKLAHASVSRSQGTFNMPITPNAYQKNTDGEDFYYIVLERDMRSVLYATYSGQFGGLGDHVDGGTSRFDPRGAIYQVICACGDKNSKPPVSIPYERLIPPGSAGRFKGPNTLCNMFAMKILFDYDGVKSSMQVSINGVKNKTNGCFPLTVDFEDTIASAQKYIWRFNDGTKPDTTTVPTVRHIFQNPGDYDVELVAIDLSKCIPRDSTRRKIVVRDDKAEPKFDFSKLGACTSLTFSFANNTLAPAGKPFNANSFIWDFGGGALVTAYNPPPHTFPGPGTYPVKLILADASYCNGPDTIVQLVRVSSVLKANFSFPKNPICLNESLSVTNTSQGGLRFEWDFDDGIKSTDPTPKPVKYSTVGSKIIKLRAIDPSTCNSPHDTTFTLNILPAPTAAFIYSPNPSKENTPTQFNSSATIGAVSIKWDFGDGRTSTLPNPIHQYRKDTLNNVCLIAVNSIGCPDTICKIVPSILKPVVGVPTAFTPNGDGLNDILIVRGYGILKFDLRVYNRWGQMVFYSNDQDIGWDGTFQSRPQPMDVYTYLLKFEYYDGTSETMKGEVTLLR